MKSLRIWLLVGLCLVLGGTLLGYTPYMQSLRSRHVARVSVSPFGGTASATALRTPAATIQGRPVRLEIPSLSIDLPVIDGYYNTQRQEWTLTKDKVQYAAMTAPANNAGGNTFLYGHNRAGVFDTLNRIQLRDTAVITTDNGHRFTYRFSGALETTPDDDALFRYQGKQILTIQTCSGAWYQHRQLFTFDLVSAQ